MAQQLDEEALETPGIEGGSSDFDVGQWLDSNKLGKYKEQFTKDQVDIEELLPLNAEELELGSIS